MTIEKLDFAFETKTVSQDGEFEGYASTFGNVDLGGDIVAPGAFATTLAKRGPRGVKMLLAHDMNKRVGVWTDLREDGKGLKVKGHIVTDLTLGRETLIELRNDMLSAMSIGYRTVKDRVDVKKGVRTLDELDLFEISLVPFPMNPKAVVTAVKTADIELRDRLAAGDRLTEREWDALFKSEVPLRLSNAQAERAVRVNLKAGRGAPDANEHDEARAFFEAFGRA